MTVKKGQWAIVCNGKVSHMMGQGYNGLAKICTPETHVAGKTFCLDYEQDDLVLASETTPKCKRCLAKVHKNQRRNKALADNQP